MLRSGHIKYMNHWQGDNDSENEESVLFPFLEMEDRRVGFCIELLDCLFREKRRGWRLDEPPVLYGGLIEAVH